MYKVIKMVEPARLLWIFCRRPGGGGGGRTTLPQAWATFILLAKLFYLSRHCNYTNCRLGRCSHGHLTFLPSCRVCLLPEPVLSVEGIWGPSWGIHTLQLSILQLTIKIILCLVMWYSRVVSKMNLCDLERTNTLSLHTNKRWRGLKSGNLPAHSNLVLTGRHPRTWLHQNANQMLCVTGNEEDSDVISELQQLGTKKTAHWGMPGLLFTSSPTRKRCEEEILRRNHSLGSSYRKSPT